MTDRPFDWRGYLRVAEKLSNDGDEAYLRTSVSRAYYFAYHLALAKAESLGFQARTRKHTLLWEFFETDAAFPHVSRLGQQMRDRRHRADYEASFVRIGEEAVATVDDARRLAELLLGPTSSK
jgi:uncharacterized protein (UPF0332 family)